MSSRFDPVPLVGSGPDLVDDIRVWVTSEPLRALVTEFGGDRDLTTPTTAELAERLAELDAFTDRWDTRLGRERNMAGHLDLSAAQAELVMDAAAALGLRSPRRPSRASYDHVLLLGGLVRACVSRPAYAAHLIRGGQITTGSVVALCGHRRFTAEEGPLAASLGLSGVDGEYEAMDAGTRAAFHLGAPEAEEGERSDLVGGTWGVRRYRDAAGTTVLVAAAPSSEPHSRRANTPDSYAWFAEYLTRLRPGQHLLMVTTPIYIPAQHAGALRMLRLPYGVDVETVGVDTAVPGVVVQALSPTNHLQEVRSAVRALRALHAAATAS